MPTMIACKFILNGVEEVKPVTLVGKVAVDCLPNLGDTIVLPTYPELELQVTGVKKEYNTHMEMSATIFTSKIVTYS